MSYSKQHLQETAQVVAQIDPAQLKTSIIELLLPKMELGLMFADITEEMCNAWTATIIGTIARRMARPLSRNPWTSDMMIRAITPKIKKIK